MAYQIQILGLRDYVDQKTGKTKKTDAFYGHNWRVDTEEEIFKNTLSIVAKIPEKERHNMYWTVARCLPERGRLLAEQWLIPWDIDEVAPNLSDEEAKAAAMRHARVACEVLGIDYKQTAIVFSGNGVQFFIKLKTPILSEEYFDSTRAHYGALVSQIKAKFAELGLPGKVDPSVFSTGRLMRLPMTQNIKPGKPTRVAEVLQENLVAVDFDLVEKSGLEKIKSGEQISPEILKRYPKPDTEAVISGCHFIKWNFEKSNEVKEFQWYAALSVVARLEEGEKLCHEMSEKHAGYNSYETDLKIEQSLKNSGPRTCKNISTLWDGCKTCPHFNTELVSPILITGPDYIKTKETGFRRTWTDENGKVKVGKPEYEDLIKEFERQYSFVCIGESSLICVYNGKHWEERTDIYIKSWMNGIVEPKPSNVEMNEFVARLKVHNVKSQHWLEDSTDRKLNFQNGVLSLDTMTLSGHSLDYGFTTVLPYAYDPRAEAPLWDQYLKDVTEGDQLLIDLLEQFGGYAIAGGNCYAQKALILSGLGGNGKSVFPETLAQIVGKNNYSTLMLNQLNNDQMRYLLVNKLFNYSDEAPDRMKAEYFKTMVTGGDMTVKRVYHPPYNIKNKAKFIILANELPQTNDVADGLYSRLLFATFNVRFRGTSRDDKQLKYKMWETELPGICNRLIAAYKKLILNNYVFIEPQSSIDARDDYQEENNNVLRFAKEFLTVIDNAAESVSMSELYAEYVSNCMASQEKPFSKVIFFKMLRRIPRFSICTFGKLVKKNNIAQRHITHCQMQKGDF